ncbi:ABC transporter ATP-binding protein [Trueperella pyogenes]|uniref:ABC transporter ATP-binding protein n=1 Tax=Trueperella pyogenes TaxID=1661 RepID=UPI002167AF06|nr:ABC transporter ATP-binding protein [Trueperella pyogenes]UVJ55701.1 ABC transporter ATP-binding protein [Trueperella pyogenes]WHU58437.1 ABC transporter ATP-binding protein [Trueperella pyogenes]
MIQKEPIIELTDVKRVYGSPPVVALNNVSFSIQHGEMLVVTGPSGSGKSTLLNLMGTLDRPSAGKITIAGHVASEAKDTQLSALRAHLIGFVFQQYHLDNTQTALDNVADGLLYTGMPRKDRRERALNALERVGLGDRATHTPLQLSGGQRQRVAIARAVAGDPPLLLADEPTGALDSRSGERVLSILRNLNEDGTTVVVITHDRDVARTFPRVIRICDGEIESDSTLRKQSE